MTDETPVNGVNPADAAKQQRMAEDMHMQSFVGPATICLVNGSVKSLAQFGVERTVLMLAACFGKCLGEVLSIGDLVPVMKLRQRCLEVIEKECKAVKVQPIPQGQPRQMTSVPPETVDLLKKMKMQ